MPSMSSKAVRDVGAELLEDQRINRNWRTRPNLTVSEWADQNRVLSPLFAFEHGSWHTDRVPHAREWMDSGSDPWVRQITIVGGTQCAKTEALNNIVGFFLHHKPSPAMFVVPKSDVIRTVAERRILPMIRDSAALAAELTDRKHDVKNNEIALRRSVLYIRGAGSPTDLASVPVRLVIGDETEKWPEWSGDEASPLSLVRERTRTFYDHLVALASTPKFRDGIIDREFHRGDRRHYNVPCPHCHAWIVFVWENVRWDHDKIPTGDAMRAACAAWYECQKCGGKIDDRQKSAACARGVWVPDGRDALEWINGGRAADRAQHRSYHIWAAYSPWLTWWKIVAQFLDAKDNPADLMGFVNSWLAQVWEQVVHRQHDDTVIACVDQDRVAGQCPDDVRVVTAAVDVQADRLEWSVAGWGYDEESWVIDAGKIQNDNGKEWDALGRTLFGKPWGHRHVQCCVVDRRGGRDPEVVDFVRRWSPIARMIAGVERDSPELFATKKIDHHPKTGQKLKQSMTLWTVNVGWFKDLVAQRMAIAQTEPDARAGRIHLPNGLPEGWLKQLNSEHKVLDTKSRTREVYRWVLRPGHRRNEAWDLMVYNAAAARLIRCETMVSPGRLGDGPPRKSTPPPPPARRPGARAPGNRFPRIGG